MYNGIKSNLSLRKPSKGRNNHQHHNILIIRNNNELYNSSYSSNKYNNKENMCDQKRNLLFLYNNQKVNNSNNLLKKNGSDKNIFCTSVNSELCEQCLRKYLSTDVSKEQKYIQYLDKNLLESYEFKPGNNLNQYYNQIPIYQNNSDLINQNPSISLPPNSDNRYIPSYDNYDDLFYNYQEKYNKKIKPITYFPNYNVDNLPIYDIIDNNNNRFVDLKFIRKKNICTSENKKLNDLNYIDDVDNYNSNIMNISNLNKNENSAKSNNNIPRRTYYYGKIITPFVKNVMTKRIPNQNKVKNNILNKNKIYCNFHSPVKYANNLSQSTILAPLNVERNVDNFRPNIKNVTLNNSFYKSNNNYDPYNHYKYFSNINDYSNIGQRNSDVYYLKSEHQKNQVLKFDDLINNSKEIKGSKQLKDNMTENLNKAKPKVKKIYVIKKDNVNNYKNNNSFVKNTKINNNNKIEKKTKDIIKNNKKLEENSKTFNIYVKDDKEYINGSKIVNSMSYKEINNEKKKTNNIRNNYKIKETVETKNKVNKEVIKTRSGKEKTLRKEKTMKSIDLSKSLNLDDKSKVNTKQEKNEVDKKEKEVKKELKKEKEKENIEKKEEETNKIKKEKNSKTEKCENKENEKNKKKDKGIVKNEEATKPINIKEKPKQQSKISFKDINSKKNNLAKKLDSNNLNGKKGKLKFNDKGESKSLSKSKSKSRKISKTKALRHSHREKDLDKLKQFKYAETRYNLNYDSSSSYPINDKKEVYERKNINGLKNHSINKKKDINIYNLNYKSFEEDFKIKNLELNNTNIKPQISCRITLTKDNYIKVQGITKFFKFTYFYSENLRNFCEIDSEDTSEFYADRQ